MAFLVAAALATIAVAPARVHMLGRSELGRPIRAVEVGGNGVGPVPNVLVVVSVLAPEERAPGPGRKVVVRFADQPELRADAKRTFRYLVNQDAGCADVTQFVGIVEPCRAPDHSHSYDEVGYVVEGEGIAHMHGREIPLRPGSCFHLPPDLVHCIENNGAGVMRILGVFHPSGDPASRAYEAND